MDFVDAIFHSERRLIRYLFSDESFVITGNDNCDEDDALWFVERIRGIFALLETMEAQNGK